MPPGSGFRSPLVGAGGVLIRDIIHSTDYNGSLTDPATTPGNLGFALTADGTLIANAAIIRGTLDAVTGTFAGDLSAAGGTFAGALSAATGTFAGDLSAAGGTFAGDLSAAGGTFAGLLTAGTIAIPDTVSVNSFHVDAIGNIWAGATTFSAAPFSVTSNGFMKATAGTFSGSLVAATGTFSGSLSAATGTFSGALYAGSLDGGVYIADRILYFGTPANTDYIQYDNVGVVFKTYIGANVRHQISGARTYVSVNTSAFGFSSAPLLISDGGLGLAGIGMWNSTPGTAAIWRCAYGANAFWARDSTDALFVPILASAFTVSSMRAEKTEITPAPAGALDLIRRLPIVRYRRLIDAHPTSAWAIDDDPDKIAAAQHQRLATATKQDWATLASQQTGPAHIETGIIVDDLDPTDALTLCRHEADKDGTMHPVGVDLYSMLATLAQAVQELDARTKG